VPIMLSPALENCLERPTGDAFDVPTCLVKLDYRPNCCYPWPFLTDVDCWYDGNEDCDAVIEGPPIGGPPNAGP